MKVRVRFAPSPTGLLHIGNLRTALYNYLFARHHGGTFLLRVEDTDRERLVPGALENILEILTWAGLAWDEGPVLKKKLFGGTKIIEKGSHQPYTQSKRTAIYQKYAEQLVKKGSAYYCFCSSERLEKMREDQSVRKEPPMYDGACRKLSQDECEKKIANGLPYVIRLAVPKEGETVFTDLVRGQIKFENKNIDDQVLVKSDGFPTYHLANVVDDHLMEITNVIRGEEWLSSTPKHILLYKAFGWTPPKFAHLPLFLNADKSKLSKRTGDVAAEEYRKKGYLPEALVNFIVLLGWNPRADQEVYTLEALVKEFDLAKVNKSGAVVNFEKLKWINGEYIRKLETKRLVKLAKPWIKKDVPEKYLENILSLVRDRLFTFDELPELTSYFFVDAPEYEVDLLKWKETSLEQTKNRLKRVLELVQGMGEWTPEKIESTLKEAIEKEKLGTGDTLWPMRVALTGRKNSPNPFEVAAVLGKEKTLKRLKAAIDHLL